MNEKEQMLRDVGYEKKKLSTKKKIALKPKFIVVDKKERVPKRKRDVRCSKW